MSTQYNITSDLLFSDQAQQRFWEWGCLGLPQLTDDAEIDLLSDLYDSRFKKTTGFTPQEMINLKDEQLLSNQLALLPMEEDLAILATTRLYQVGSKIAAWLNQVPLDQVIGGWRFFLKPARATATPWHQDAAYRQAPFRTLSIWTALDTATIENSCLFYEPGSHRGEIAEHQWHNRYLVAQNPPLVNPVAFPRARGESVVHHCKTLHQASPNQTEKPRRAIDIVFNLKD